MPKISILMPVYNGEDFLSSAIESVLQQTFKDFEFIIINDGSTDSSLSLIKQYAKEDRRIKLISHSNNGVGRVLNEGLALATGIYIARMDADDVSLPGRLKEQVEYLDAHSECAAVFSKIQLIDSAGEPLEDWGPDVQTTTPDEIKAFMPIENCCAHPSVMIRAKILKQFKYDEAQVPSEDYDLWLRLLSSGKDLHKINEKLVLYRMHDSSISQLSNRNGSPQKKILRAKSKFLHKQLRSGNFGYFEINVLRSFLDLLTSMIWRKSAFTLAKFVPAPIKRLINTSSSFVAGSMSYLLTFLRNSKAHVHILVNKWVLSLHLRKVKPLHDDIGVLVVIPWMTVGGAEKILLDLIVGLGERGIKVFCISTTAKSNEWAALYSKHCNELIDLGKLSLEENKAWFIATYVLKKELNTVITTNNLPGYKAAKIIKNSQPSVKVFDILHGQGGEREGGGWPLFSMPYDKYINKRVVVTNYLKDYLVHKHKIDKDKIVVIHNGIAELAGLAPRPAREIVKFKNKFIVLWAGRFSYEKHPELAIEVAKIVATTNKNIHFIIAGDGEMRTELLNRINKYQLEDAVTITKEPYKDPRTYMNYSNVLLMSSEMEGLPVVILEALSLKLPVIAPRVGGIPEIIKDSIDGFLIDYSSHFADEASRNIVSLSNNARLAKKIARAGHKKIESDFSMPRMIASYAKLLSDG